MILLKDAPGGPALIEALTNAIRDLSLLYAGTPDDRASAHLETYIKKIEPGIVAAVGAGRATSILTTFASAVMGEKHKHEAMAASRA